MKLGRTPWVIKKDNGVIMFRHMGWAKDYFSLLIPGESHTYNDRPECIGDNTSEISFDGHIITAIQNFGENCGKIVETIDVRKI